MLLAGGIIIGFVHLMFAVLVVGGSVFLNVLLPKTIAHLPAPEQGRIKSIAGKYFGMLAWASTVLILLTGVIRSVVLGLFAPDVLFGTTYGLLLAGKIVLFGWVIANSVVITKTGIAMEGAARADGGSAVAVLEAGDRRIHALGLTNDIVAAIIILLAVAMRFIGVPTL